MSKPEQQNITKHESIIKHECTMHESTPKHTGMQDGVQKLLLGILLATLFIIAFNSVRLSGLNSVVFPSTISGGGQPSTLAGSAADFMPTGVPAVYGKELSVRYDDVSASDPQKADATIKILGDIDQQVTLSGKDKERYINILYTMNKGISCEYCCGARAIIFSDGQPACGCAHSYAMRGLTKHLIKNHGKEYTDDQIQEEVGKWKALFFPGQMNTKAQVLNAGGIEINFVNLASNKYRGIEQGQASGQSGSGMVGGC